jgi:hypothetical protein
MKVFVMLLVVNTIALSWWWAARGSVKSSILLGLGGVFISCVLVFSDRITDLTLNGIGSIKAAAQQAQVDANTVSELRKRVEGQSATVDLVAQEASKAKVLSEEVASKNDRAERKLTALDDTIKGATSTLRELESVTEFTMTVVAAQNDDRKAFDRLRDWSQDAEHPFRDRAMQAWSTIFESHSKPYYTSGFHIPWADGFDPSQLSLGDLTRYYLQASSQLKPALLEYIWKRDDLPKIERLDFLMDVMKNDSSLSAVEYAGRYFTSGTEQKIKPVAVDVLSRWWDEHRKEFEDVKSQ